MVKKKTRSEIIKTKLPAQRYFYLPLNEKGKIAQYTIPKAEEDFKILSNTPILMMVTYLKKYGPASTKELSEIISQSYRNTERHIIKLRKKGIIETEKKGKFLISTLTKKGEKIWQKPVATFTIEKEKSEKVKL
ncbi:MAG: helix-turn-helix transcriptional regulator [Nanoarchaeota archaeon]